MDIASFIQSSDIMEKFGQVQNSKKVPESLKGRLNNFVEAARQQQGIVSLGSVVAVACPATCGSCPSRRRLLRGYK